MHISSLHETNISLRFLMTVCCVGVAFAAMFANYPVPHSSNAGTMSDDVTQSKRQATSLQHSPVQSRSKKVISPNDTYGKLPLGFEANEGQTDKQVKFLSRGRGYGLFLTSSGAVLSLKRRALRFSSNQNQLLTQSESNDHITLAMRLNGSDSSALIKGVEQLPGKVNYFIGNDSSKWHTNVSTYSQVHYEGIYPGIDLVYYGSQRQLEYDFRLAKGSSVRTIRLGFEGAR